MACAGLLPGGIMELVHQLEQAREAHRRQAWAEVCDAFFAVDRITPLGVEDLERLAEAADILGRTADAVGVLRRVYQVHADARQTGRALRCAFWLWHALNFKGEVALASGWIRRAARLIEAEPHMPEQGYVLIPEAEDQFGKGDYAAAYTTAGRAAALGNRCADPDLVTIATHIQGRAGIKAGQVREGLALLDEAMVGIAAGETTARVTAWIYCSAIDACNELHELRRAREWTTALNAWCDARPQFTGAFSGVCRIHRSELLHLGGAWPEAVLEAQLACEQLTEGRGEAGSTNQLLTGAACYQLGELHRLRGEWADAEDAYRRSGEHGWQVQPGLALLRLAQGRVDVATAGIRRALAETSEPLARSRLLPAHTEIVLVAGELVAASESATELSETASRYDTAALHARSAHARGAVHLAAGRPDAALQALRQAWRLWRDLDAPYEAARVRVLVGMVCRELHDEDSAAMELDAARQVFDRLGAAPDTARVDALTKDRTPDEVCGLSPREMEVLRLVAAGRTNQAIAAELFLSTRTVDRHVSNILAKLGVPSRTAAAAYAFAHGIC
jgi:DNA-binding NarL/FixJ family response regulator